MSIGSPLTNKVRTSSSPATDTAVLTESRLWLRLLVSMVRVKAMAESGVTVAWRGTQLCFLPSTVVPVLGRAGSNQLVQTFPWRAAGTMAAEARQAPHQCARVRAGGGEYQRGGGEHPHLHHTSLGFLGKNTCAKTVGTAVVWWLIGPGEVHGAPASFSKYTVAASCLAA